MMQFKYLSIAAFMGVAAAQQQNLTAALSSSPQLSNLTTFVSQFPQLLQSLSQASNITILAPSNDAFSEFLSSDAGGMLASDPGLLQAVLQYHVLNGSYPSSAITNTTAFVPTLLTNASYANVTGGQRVAAALVDGNVTFFSGLLANSTVTQAVRLHALCRVLLHL
jgi:uncharacterized surface protein with fasciclin (FAS1) repeats